MKTNTCVNETIYEISESCQIPRLEMFFEDIFGNKRNGLFVDVGALKI